MCKYSLITSQEIKLWYQRGSYLWSCLFKKWPNKCSPVSEDRYVIQHAIIVADRNFGNILITKLSCVLIGNFLCIYYFFCNDVNLIKIEDKHCHWHFNGFSNLHHRMINIDRSLRDLFDFTFKLYCGLVLLEIYFVCGIWEWGCHGNENCYFIFILN